MWRIYYDDDTTFDDTDGEPWESPKFGVQGVVQRLSEVPKGRSHVQRLTGADWYVYRYDLGQWFKVDEFGVWDQAIHYSLSSVFRPGRAIGAMAWDAVFKRMMDDPDYQQDSKNPGEEREAQYRDEEGALPT